MEKKNVDVQNNEIKEFHINTESNLHTREEVARLFIDNVIQRIIKEFEDVDRGLESYVLRKFSKVLINICKFERVGLNGYKPYPEVCRGRTYIYNPETRENCLLIALATFKKLNANPQLCYRNIT